MQKILPLAGLLVLLACHAAGAAEPLVVPVWPHREPGPQAAEEKVTDRSKDPAKPDRSITHVSWPTLTVYPAPDAAGPSAAVIICPGGGYGSLAIDKEGHDVARWLNSIGVAGLVLKYRMPRPDLAPDEKPFPLQDAQQALRLARTRAADWHIDPARLGIMGFSAGGHLASAAGTHFDAGNPTAADPVDRQSCRPDFLILGYPVVTFHDPIAHKGSRANLIGKTPTSELIDEYSNELHVTDRTPPAFLVHARDDGVKVENSITFDAALRRAGVASHLQLYDKGGHGFGLGVHGGEVAEWPKRCQEWLASRGLLAPSKP